MKPTINKNVIMSLAHKRHTKFKNTNQIISVRLNGDVYSTDLYLCNFSDCLRLAWHNEKYRIEQELKAWYWQAEQARLRAWRATDEYKLYEEQQSNGKWMRPEAMKEYYETNEYKGD